MRTREEDRAPKHDATHFVCGPYEGWFRACLGVKIPRFSHRKNVCLITLLLRICAIEQTCGKGRQDEKVYCQLGLCRLMGNPIAFAAVDALSQNKEFSPSEIAHAVGRSVSRVSHVLASLRLAEVVAMTLTGDRRATA